MTKAARAARREDGTDRPYPKHEFAKAYQDASEAYRMARILAETHAPRTYAAPKVWIGTCWSPFVAMVKGERRLVVRDRGENRVVWLRDGRECVIMATSKRTNKIQQWSTFEEHHIMFLDDGSKECIPKRHFLKSAKVAPVPTV